MKILLILCFILLVKGNVHAQDNKILYYVTQSIIDSLNKNFDLNKSIGCLWNDEGENIVLVFFEVDSTSELNLLVKKTNRFLCIENIEIPIVFHSDFKFSTIFNTNHGDNTASTSAFISLGGYVVRFKGLFMSGYVLESFYDW
jgi:hypothetical protein